MQLLRYRPLLTMVLMLAFSAIHAAPARILVYGGSGNIGRQIVREALDRGHEVTVVSREPSRFKDRHDRLKVVAGNVLDSTGVTALAQTQDVLVSAVGADRANNPDYHIYRKAAESLVTALRSLGPKAPRLIVVGGAGSLEVSPGVLLVTRIPERYRAEVLGQKEALDYYGTIKDVRWTYFSPAGSLAPGNRTGKFRLGGDQLITDAQGDSKISIEDYAVALIDESEKANHIGKRFTIGY